MLAATALHAPSAPELPQDIRWMNLGAALLAGVGLAMVLAWGLISVARLPWFDLKHIVIDGDLQRHNLMTVRANTVPRLQGGFFSVDLEAAQQAAKSKAAWNNSLTQKLSSETPNHTYNFTMDRKRSRR